MARTAVTGLKVQVRSNGRFCREFPVPDDDTNAEPRSDNVETKYIQTEPGATFEIHVHVATTYPYHDYDLCVGRFVGGVDAGGRYYRRGIRHSRTRATVLVQEGRITVENGRTTFRRFKFYGTTVGRFGRFDFVDFIADAESSGRTWCHSERARHDGQQCERSASRSL
jgi:hypothetical protein